MPRKWCSKTWKAGTIVRAKEVRSRGACLTCWFLPLFSLISTLRKQGQPQSFRYNSATVDNWSICEAIRISCESWLEVILEINKVPSSPWFWTIFRNIIFSGGLFLPMAAWWEALSSQINLRRKDLNNLLALGLQSWNFLEKLGFWKIYFLAVQREMTFFPIGGFLSLSWIAPMKRVQ